MIEPVAKLVASPTVSQKPARLGRANPLDSRQAVHQHTQEVLPKLEMNCNYKVANHQGTFSTLLEQCEWHPIDMIHNIDI